MLKSITLASPDVGRFQVEMQIGLAVNIVYRRREVSARQDHVGQAQSLALLDQPSQRGAWQGLQDQDWLRLLDRLAGANDVGMGETREQPPLTQQSPPIRFSSCAVGVRDLRDASASSILAPDVVDVEEISIAPARPTPATRSTSRRVVPRDIALTTSSSHFPIPPSPVSCNARLPTAVTRLQAGRAARE